MTVAFACATCFVVLRPPSEQQRHAVCVEFFQPLIPMRSELFTRIPTAYVTSEASVTSREISLVSQHADNC